MSEYVVCEVGPALGLTAANIDGEPLLARLPTWRIRKILEQIRIVESLRFSGDERPYGVLRSIALGMLDEPDSLDDLYAQVRAARTGEEPQAEPEPVSESESESDDTTPTQEPRPEQPEQTVPAAFTRPARDRRDRPKTVLYLHFDRTWGTYSLDGVGAITRSEAVEILGHSEVTIRPVIDLETPSHRRATSPHPA